jgi:hypothetical protein
VGELVGGTWSYSAWSGLTDLEWNSPTFTMSTTGWPYYIGLNQHIFSPNSGTDLTNVYNMEPVELTAGNTQYSPLAGGVDDSGTQHIFYIGADAYIHEMYGGIGGSGWSLNTVKPSSDTSQWP